LNQAFEIRQTFKQKGLDYLNEDDYKKLDLWFLKTALDELNIV